MKSQEICIELIFFVVCGVVVVFCDFFKTLLVLLCIENVHKLPNATDFSCIFTGLWVNSVTKFSCGTIFPLLADGCWSNKIWKFVGNQAKLIRNQNLQHISYKKATQYWHSADSVHLHWPKLSFQSCKILPKTKPVYFGVFLCRSGFFKAHLATLFYSTPSRRRLVPLPQ